MGSGARDGIAYIFKIVKCFSDRDLPILPSRKQERCGPRGPVLAKGERLSRVCISCRKVEAVPVGVDLMVLWSCASETLTLSTAICSPGVPRAVKRAGGGGAPLNAGVARIFGS